MTIPLDISEKENLGRIIVSESQAKNFRKNKKRKFHVFLEVKGKRTLSVDRLDIGPLEYLVLNGEKVAANRKRPDGSQRVFWGWAVITAENASTNGREVVASPQKDNPYHADIILPDISPDITSAENKKRQERHAQQLADRASWRGRDENLI